MEDFNHYLMNKCLLLRQPINSRAVLSAVLHKGKRFWMQQYTI